MWITYSIIQLTTSVTDFFVVAQMSVDLVGFVNLVGFRCGLPRLKQVVKVKFSVYSTNRTK